MCYIKGFNAETDTEIEIVELIFPYKHVAVSM